MNHERPARQRCASIRQRHPLRMGGQIEPLGFPSMSPRNLSGGPPAVYFGDFFSLRRVARAGRGLRKTPAAPALLDMGAAGAPFLKRDDDAR